MGKIDFSNQAEMMECLANACPKLEQQDWQYASDVYEGKLKPVDGKAMFWADNERVKLLQLRLIALGHATRRIPKDTPLQQAQPLHVKDYAVCQALGVGVVLERSSFDRPDWDRQHPTLNRLKTFVEEVKRKYYETVIRAVEVLDKIFEGNKIVLTDDRVVDIKTVFKNLDIVEGEYEELE
jgi:hypothetical protein